MESKFFTWDGWDSLDLLSLFTNCTLKQKIGRYPVGSKIPLIELDYGNGAWRFYDNEGEVIAEGDLEMKFMKGVC